MISIVELTVLAVWCSTVLADSTNLALINLTPYDLIQSLDPHSYQMVSWDDAFPASVGAQSYTSAFIQLATGLIEEADDAGEFYYTLNDGSANTIQIALDVTGSTAAYTINFDANFDGISTQNNPISAPLGFRDSATAWTPFILQGDATSGYVGNNPPSDWMQQNLPFIGCQSLQGLTIPGTHNSGMSLLQFNTPFSWPSNTQTQVMNVLGQLNAGARYFDIRPVITNSDFYTGHYTRTDQAGWQGGAGQSISEVIDNINEFTATNSELIILHLSHTVNTEMDFAPFDDDEWNNVLFRFYSDLNYRWEVAATEPLTTLPLSEFISTGPAVVLIVDERDQAWLDSYQYTGRGFFPATAFPMYGSYAESDDLNFIRENQYQKLLEQNASPNLENQLFVLAWTVTMYGGNNINPLDHITVRGDIMNDHLAEVGDAPYNSPFLWGAGDSLPNIISIDTMRENKHLAALALAFNRYYSTC